MGIHTAHPGFTNDGPLASARRALGTVLLFAALLWAPATAGAEQRGQVVFADVPGQIQAGQSAQVLVRYENTGTTTWKASTLHRLGALSGANEVEWFDWKCGGYSNSTTDQRAFLCHDVPPGATHEFNFRIRAPGGASGSVRLSVKMVQDGVEWFDWFGSWDIAVTGGGATNDAEVLGGESDVPDALGPGERESVRIRVRNTGSGTWRAGTNHRLGAEFAGNRNEVLWDAFQCGGYMNSPTDARVFLCHDVAPGATHDFRFEVAMPSGASGSRRLAVHMVQDGVEFFGSSRSWTIDVDDPPPPTCPNDPLATPSDRWKLEIWSNTDFSGPTVEQRYDAAGAGGFAFDWGNGDPTNCGPSDHFAVRFSRRVNLPDATTYTFTTTTDDGVRLWVDGALVIDRWQNQARTSHTASRALSAGPHDLRMDYYDGTGQAYAGLSWVANVPEGACPQGTIDLADYLLGSPEVRIHIRHDHGGEEHFSYRAGGTVDGLDQHFLVKSLDGVSWEEFGVDDDFMYRHRDTSWSQTCDLNGTQVPAYYLLRDSDRDRFARLAPRCMAVGQSWSNPVQSYVDGGYRAPDRCDLGCQTPYSEAWITLVATLVARHEQFTTTEGLAIHDLPGQPDVIEFVTGPFNDHFWLARGIGMIQFEGPNPNGPPFQSGAYQIDFDQPPAAFVGLCGEQIGQRSFHVGPGDTAPLVADVPGGQSKALFATSWPGSDVLTTLRSPSGRVIERGTVAPDLAHQVGPTSEQYTLRNPEAGEWQVSLFGADLPLGGEEVGFSLATVAAAPPDTTPPVLTPTVTGTSGSNGWYVSPVTVEWSVLDPESGVPDFSGCQPRTLGDTSGITVTCSATNGAGLAAVASVTIKVDTTPPLVTLAVIQGTPGTNGWYVSDVMVATQGADPTSGVASCTPHHVQTTETTGTVLQGTCVNGAGLVGHATPFTLRVDKTPPVLTAQRSPEPNASGWNDTDVTVTFSCLDTVSGVAQPPASPQVVSTEGAGQSVSAFCADAAGHAATATVLGISIDKTPPAISIVSPQGAEYLKSARLPMSWTVTESLSGIDSERAQLDHRTVSNGQVVSLSSIGNGGHTLEVVAFDVAGNRGAASARFQVLSSLPKAPHVDWPLGTCTGGDLVLGRDVDVVRDYGDRTHPLFGPAAHTGLDLKLRTGSSAGAPVHAAADGTFECANTEPGDIRPDYPGGALVLKHKLADGGTLYTQYGHLEAILVSPGQVVRRGDVIGRVLDQDAAGETHLHFEVRKFASRGADDCAGPGQASGSASPDNQGWRNPVPFYYTHRPSHPAVVVTWSDPSPLPLRAKPRADAAILGSLPGSSRVEVIGVVKDEGCSSPSKCASWWYKLRDASGRRVFLNGFGSGGDGRILTVGEPRRTGARWSSSSGRLLVDYRFDDPDDFAAGVVANEAHPGRRDGRILGSAELVDGASGGADDKSLFMDGETARVEVEDSQHLRFRDGIEVEAWVRRESGSTADAVLSHGGEDGPWRLTLSPDGRLVFETRFENGGHARVEHRIPACEHLGLWVHVAAHYDPDDGLRLFWNGNQVARKGGQSKRLARAREPIRLGEAGDASRWHGRVDAVRIRELHPHRHEDCDDDEDDDDDDDEHDD